MPRRTAQNQTQESTQVSTQENAQGSMAANDLFKVRIMEHGPERGVRAIADVQVGDFMTIRNVRIKEDDYGLTVNMPRTKMAHTEQYKDSVFFSDKSMKDAFDQAVKDAYESSMDLLQEDAQTEEVEREEGMFMEQGM